MNHQNPENYQQPTTFEVTIPAHASPDQLVALNGLTAAFGWRVNKIIRGSSKELRERGDEVIQDRDFTSLSEEMFMSDIPGRNAINLFKAERDHFTGYAEVIEFGRDCEARRIEWRSMHKSSLHPSLDLPHNYRISQNAFEEHVLDRIKGSSPPFNMRITSEANQKLSPIEFMPEELTFLNVGEYAKTRRYKEHTLKHGAIPQMIDVLLKTSGIIEDSNYEEIADFEYISKNSLDQILRSRLGFGTVELVHKKIEEALFEQLVTGKPTSDGEIAVEGILTPDFSISRVDYEKIAVQTLATVASRYKNTKNGLAKSILLEIAKQGEK